MNNLQLYMHDLLLSNLEKHPSVYFELTIIQLLFARQIVLKNKPIDVCPFQESGSIWPLVQRGSCRVKRQL
jgi:hypothetical protein